MLRKFVLGLAAAASLSAMALAPSAASAHPWGGGWGWGGGFHHFHGFGVGYLAAPVDSCYVTRSVLTPYGYRLRTVNVCYCSEHPDFTIQSPRSPCVTGAFGMVWSQNPAK